MDLPYQNAMVVNYQVIYDMLGELRESFHRSGRLDDSNAKLDEVSKIFATYLAFKKSLIPFFPTPNSTNIINELNNAFELTTYLPQYQTTSNNSIFGTAPKLILRIGDEELAKNLVILVTECIGSSISSQNNNITFDVLNEAFGHFVRDNFRGNVEDAQYMTPPEVVDFMVDMVFKDLEKEDPSVFNNEKHWTILDPTCGVGSFLTTVYHKSKSYKWLDRSRLKLYGQDKVERMVRLATINLELFDVEAHQISIGNSLENDSPIDDLKGKVDLIFTNPPFGARFEKKYIEDSCYKNIPFFSSLKQPYKTIDSELLFLERNLELLKPGGRLAIVLPDGVVSAKGMAALIRQHLSTIVSVKAIIELPATTFAQAGTRTKCAVLYLVKGKQTGKNNVFMGIVNDIGFQVASRKGIQVKVLEGSNELNELLHVYSDFPKSEQVNNAVVLNKTPSAVVIPESILYSGTWTPNHYSAIRFETILSMSKDKDFTLEPLDSLVEFCGDKRKSEAWQPGVAFISVLHILGEGFVDAKAAIKYAPISGGAETKPNEILISRINPRIPRVCITPDFGIKTLCSGEFEILECKDGVDPFMLVYLLQSEVVQNQICSLTSGTSASHNRIKTSELKQVLIPIAIKGTHKQKLIENLSKEYKSALINLAVNATSLAKIRQRDIEILPNSAMF